MDPNNITPLAIFLFFIMFIYSGIMKILRFPDKILILRKKTGLPYPINELGMIGVIILEIIGSLSIVYYFTNGIMKKGKLISREEEIFGGIKISTEYIKYLVKIYLLFMVVVTFIYHPPWANAIPFLSNVTTFAGFLLIYNML